MKILNLILCLSLCFFFACNTDTKSPAATPEVVEKTTAESAPKTEPSSTHVAPSAEARFVAMWHYETIVGNVELKEAYVGRWINMKRDNSFTSGIYFDEDNSGTWSFNENTKIMTLKFDKEEEIETEWLVNSNGDFVIWIGNANTNTTGLQIKMARYPQDKLPAK
ncbi:MAG: hypothetical protein AB8F74_14710 [Saprospiraceae bacterium]